jgi:hypothetical protein
MKSCWMKINFNNVACNKQHNQTIMIDTRGTIEKILLKMKNPNIKHNNVIWC